MGILPINLPDQPRTSSAREYITNGTGNSHAVIQKSLGMDGEQSVDLFLVRTPPCTFLSFKAMAFPFPSSERPPASTQILSDQVELVIFICSPQMSSTSSSKSPKFTPISSASSSSG